MLLSLAARTWIVLLRLKVSRPCDFENGRRMHDAKRMNLNKTLTLPQIFFPSRRKHSSIRSCTLLVQWHNDTRTHAQKKMTGVLWNFVGKCFDNFDGRDLRWLCP